MRPTRRTALNAALYGALGLLIGVYHAELGWAARAFPTAFFGGFAPLREITLFNRAAENLEAGGDMVRTRDLLRQSLAIDPNSIAWVVLGESYRIEGDDEQALEHFQHYLELDPDYLFPYLRLAEIYAEQGRDEERRSILDRGVTHFSQQLARHRPHYDQTVEARYNQRARADYQYYQNALRALRLRQ